MRFQLIVVQVVQLTPLSAGSIPGRILPAHLADRIGRFNVMALISFLSGLSILALWLPLEVSLAPTHPQILVFAALYGFFSGAVVSMILPCVAELGSIATLGQRFGTYEAFIAVA